jgi:hypothetical protein
LTGTQDEFKTKKRRRTEADAKRNRKCRLLLLPVELIRIASECLNARELCILSATCWSFWRNDSLIDWNACFRARDRVFQMPETVSSKFHCRQLPDSISRRWCIIAFNQHDGLRWPRTCGVCKKHDDQLYKKRFLGDDVDVDELQMLHHSVKRVLAKFPKNAVDLLATPASESSVRIVYFCPGCDPELEDAETVPCALSRRWVLSSDFNVLAMRVAERLPRLHILDSDGDSYVHTVLLRADVIDLGIHVDDE